MEELIEALTILRKYGNPKRPLQCEHDELWICGIHPNRVSAEDMDRLQRLGFFVSGDGHQFKSNVFGSA